MTSERSSSSGWASQRARAFSLQMVLGTASFAALAACNARPEEAAPPQEVSVRSVTELDNGPAWPVFPTLPRAYHAGVELGNGRALVCGGKDNTEVYPPNCELLSAQGGTLTSVVYPLPASSAGGQAEGRFFPTLTLLPTGGVLVVGGLAAPLGLELDARASRPIAEWQPAGSNPNLNWLAREPMTVTRERHVTALLGTSVVVIGGYNRSDPTAGKQIEIRTDSGAAGVSWSVFGTSAAVVGHSLTPLKPDGSGARVLVLGGLDPKQKTIATGFIFSLDSTKPIAPIPDLPGSGRYNHTATLLDDEHGSVLVVGGERSYDGGAKVEFLTDAWRYDPVDEHWSQAGTASPIPLAARSKHAAARLDGRVIVAGGEAPIDPASPTPEITALRTVQSYDWRHDEWSNLRSLTEPRAFFQLLKLSDTELVASGGWRRNGVDSPPNSELITLSPLGAVSVDTLSCASGHQADGVCCESACDGPCEACNAQGKCEALSGTPHDGHPSCAGNLLCASGKCPARCDASAQCASGFFCTAQGNCQAQKDVGASCTAGTECANGAPCVDNVCCESACSGSCETCSKGTGECRALGKGELPLPSHPACSAISGGDPACAARCDGVTRDRCAFPGANSLCSAASCEQEGEREVLRTASACDGHGACQAVKVEQCAPYACDTDQNQCLHECSSDQECSDGAHCDESGACARCSISECNGFQCDRKADQCKHTCQRSETDCVGGYYCHPLDHRCVAAVPFPASALPACSLGTSRRGGYQSLALIAAASFLLLTRRRRLTRSA